MVAPTAVLWLYVLALSVLNALTADEDGIPTRADLVSRVALSLVIATWVTADARKRAKHLCYDYDSLVFFAWPVIVPVYLFQTRSLRGFYTILCFAGLWIIGAVFAYALTLVF